MRVICTMRCGNSGAWGIPPVMAVSFSSNTSPRLEVITKEGTKDSNQSKSLIPVNSARSQQIDTNQIPLGDRISCTLTVSARKDSWIQHKAE